MAVEPSLTTACSPVAGIRGGRAVDPGDHVANRSGQCVFRENTEGRWDDKLRHQVKRLFNFRVAVAWTAVPRPAWRRREQLLPMHNPAALCSAIGLPGWLERPLLWLLADSRDVRLSVGRRGRRTGVQLNHGLRRRRDPDIGLRGSAPAIAPDGRERLAQLIRQGQVSRNGKSLCSGRVGSNDIERPCVCAERPLPIIVCRAYVSRFGSHSQG